MQPRVPTRRRVLPGPVYTIHTHLERVHHLHSDRLNHPALTEARLGGLRVPRGQLQLPTGCRQTLHAQQLPAAGQRLHRAARQLQRLRQRLTQLAMDYERCRTGRGGRRRLQAGQREPVTTPTPSSTLHGGNKLR